MMDRSRRSTVLAGFAVALFVGYVIQASWSGRPVSFDSILFFLIVGVTIGSIYAVAASGLVVTYTTSGIFNFAQGAIGMFMAFVYWELKVNYGIQTILALALTVLVAAPLFGAGIERLLMRRLATAPLVAQLVVTIGLMLALIGMAAFIWPPGDPHAIGTFFGSDGFNIGKTFMPYYRLITIVAGIVIAIVLRFVLYRTRLGVAMRAVVDNRDLAGLNGVRPGRVSAASWALGAAMAAIAGIFLAEELSTLSIEVLTLLIVDAFAAAIIGRLKSLPLTYVGGLIIGLSISFQQNFLTWTGRWSSASFAIPTIILFLALLFLPQDRIEGKKSYALKSPRLISLRRALVGFAIVFVTVLILSGGLDRPNVRRLTIALVTALIMVSLVPLTGWSGQISLAQITFVGIGAWATFEFSTAGGELFGLKLLAPGNPLLLLVGAIVAVPFGVLMALPALRLRGLYLALATMAFARMAEFVIFDQPEVFGGQGRNIADLKFFGTDISAPFTLFGIDFPRDAGFLILTGVLFGVVGMIVVALRRGGYGRRLVAMRDSPAACATLGVNLSRTKLSVFMLSAAIAGFAGALLGTARGTASTLDFQMLTGLPYLLLLVVGGASIVSGALLGGVLLQLFTWITVIFPHGLSIPGINLDVVDLEAKLGPGLAGISIGRNPEGVITDISNRWQERSTPAVGPAGAPAPEPVPVVAPIPVAAAAARVDGATAPALLDISDVAVRFGGLQVLEGVSIDVRPGHVTGLIGPNGAGKTTLFNVITGLQAPTAGRVLIDGTDITQSKPHQRARLGIGRTFQRLETFDTLSARDNVLVAAEMRRAWSREKFDPAELADLLIARVGLQAVAGDRVDSLPTGTQRLVEVARALASKPRVLLLDEPSSGLDATETAALSDLLRELAADGLAILLVEHDMSFVMGACENIHVLDFGKIISRGTPTEVQASDAVRAAYLGDDREQLVAEVAPSLDAMRVRDVTAATLAGADGAPVALALRDVRAAYGNIEIIHGLDLVVPEGHVFALLGPNGAGKSTALKIASGQLGVTKGSVEVAGRDVRRMASDQLARDGVCLVPEGRGIFPNLTVTENLRMATYTGVSFSQVLERSFEQFPRLADRRKQVAGTLSGGEQQMLAMARALASDPKVLLLDELSMGLAPLIVEELYQVVKRIAESGVSILVVEQFAHEVLGVADIAAIMLHGRIELLGAPAEVGPALDHAYLGGTVVG
ncbi:MAG TPA: ATP-binding cassette domain-containing protein [Acidimicrobiia bacterium]|jgi:ABC-type branched-subunit amino acid transport system ATPase component/branched-subunit amino acid ABC-type transport system permease component